MSRNTPPTFPRKVVAPRNARRFTTVHHEQIAAAIRRIHEYDAHAARVWYLETAELFEHDNDRFDRDLYRIACGQFPHYADTATAD